MKIGNRISSLTRVSVRNLIWDSIRDIAYESINDSVWGIVWSRLRNPITNTIIRLNIYDNR